MHGVPQRPGHSLSARAVPFCPPSLLRPSAPTSARRLSSTIPALPVSHARKEAIAWDPEGGEEVKVQSKAVFAVVQVGSHQFKVTPDDVIYTEKIKGAEVNSVLELDKVLMLGSKEETVVGRPVLKDAFVKALVEEQLFDAKVIVFKKKRRKNYRRHQGHRQQLTRLRILDVVGI